jgi:hypothetical protein
MRPDPRPGIRRLGGSGRRVREEAAARPDDHAVAMGTRACLSTLGVTRPGQPLVDLANSQHLPVSYP